MAMSPLKKQLLSMQAAPASGALSKGGKQMASRAPGTNSKGSSTNGKNGGTTTFYKPDKTGADRSPQTKSAQKALKMHGVQYENKTPTGNKAPKGQLKTQGKAALKGKLKKLWS